MSYRPGDFWSDEFTTQSFTTGAPTDSDFTPVLTAVYSGSDTDAWPFTVTAVGTGVYAMKGTIPATYAAGASVNIRAVAGVGSLNGTAVVAAFRLGTDIVSLVVNPAVAGNAMLLTAAGYTAVSSEVWTAVQRLLTGAVTVTGVVSLQVNPAVAGDAMLLSAAGYTAVASSVWTAPERLLTGAVTVTGVVSLAVDPAEAGDAMILTAGGYTAVASEVWTAPQRLLTGAVTVTGVVSLQVNPAVAGNAMALTAGAYTAVGSEVWTAPQRLLTGASTITGIVSLAVNPAVAGDAMNLTASALSSVVAGAGGVTATEISSSVWTAPERLLTGASTVTGVVSIVANAPVNIVQVAGVVVSGVADFKATGFATPANVTAATSVIGGADGDTLKTIGDAIAAIGSQTGAGADTVTIYITDASSNAVADADVWIQQGANVVAGTLQSDSDGKVAFLLDSGSVYTLFRQKDGITFGTNPRTFTAVAD